MIHHGTELVRPSQLMIKDTTSLTELIGVWIRVSVSIYSVTEPAVSLFLEFSMHAKTKFCISVRSPMLLGSGLPLLSLLQYHSLH